MQIFSYFEKQKNWLFADIEKFIKQKKQPSFEIRIML